MPNHLKVLNFLRKCPVRHVGLEPASKKMDPGSGAGVTVDVNRDRACQVVDIKGYFSKNSIMARLGKGLTGSEVVATATEAKVKELTAQYQPIVEKQVASLFPKLGAARQALVESVTRELVDLKLFTT